MRCTVSESPKYTDDSREDFMKTKTQLTTQKLVLSALMTAMVVVFQLLATFTAFFGPFSTAIALVPIVIGAALCGPIVGAWLGFAFGMVVLLSGGAALFLAYNIPGTVVTVLVKGIACGLAAGIVYHLLEKFNRYLAVFAAAIICPIANTGIFMLGTAIFFLDFANEIAGVLALDVSGMAVFWALAMANFLFELGLNIVMSPVILRIINIKKKSH